LIRRIVREIAMPKRIAAIVLLAGLLAACGSQPIDRGASGAGIGAGIGLIAGPIGVATGALIGGGVGLLTTEDTIDLGEPVWR
jgi:hypothetical protein